MNDLVKSSLMDTLIPQFNDSTPHCCDSVLHILQYPRNILLDKKMNLRQVPLSDTTVVHLRRILLMKPAPLSVSHSIFQYLLGIKKSTRRDSNPRPSPWQGDTPPLSHSCMFWFLNRTMIIIMMPFWFVNHFLYFFKVFFFFGFLELQPCKNCRANYQ